MSNPDVGPRCSECRLGLGIHNTRDPYCNHHRSRPTIYAADAYVLSAGQVRPHRGWFVEFRDALGYYEVQFFDTWTRALEFANRIATGVDRWHA